MGMVATWLSGCDEAFMLDRAGEPCPTTYTASSASTSLYRFVAGPVDWIRAHDACRADSSTGITHLVVFETTGELSAAQTELPVIGLTHAGYGRRADGNANQFYSVTGVAISPTSLLWAPVEPDNGHPSDEETVVMFAGNSRLADVSTATDGDYLCECDALPTPLSFEPPL